MPEPRAFPTGGVVAREDLVGREPTLADLLERTFRQRNSVVLTASRQTGKTSVVSELLARVRKQGGWGVYVDCSMATDVADFAELVAAATYDEAAGDKGAFGKLADMLKALPVRPVLFQSDTDIAIAFHSEDSRLTLTQQLDRALGLADRLGEERKKRCVVVYDEFPLLRKLSPKLFDQVRSTLQRATKQTAYVFMGSEVGILEELFRSRRRMPFKLGTIVQLPAPSEAEWIAYVDRRFRELRRPLAAGEARELVAFSGGHPRDLMEICQNLLALRNLRATSSPADVQVAQSRTFESLRVHFEDVWNGLDEPHGTRIVAVRVATGKRVYSRSALPTRQVKRGLDKLEHEGIIRKVGRGGYEFSEPLFGRFVREISER